MSETKYDKLIIYYFSGTGNAKNAAIWIQNVAKKRGLKTQLNNIDRFENIEAPKLTDKTLVGFCSPTHGFNMPPIVLKYIRKFPSVKNTDAFILNTRGGLKLHKLFLPGLSGIAQYLTAIILLFKGFRIVGMQPLDLPSNWLILHPGLRKKVIISMHKRCKNIVERFANKLLDGKKIYKAFLSLPFDLIVAPIAVGYYFIGRFFLAKTLISTFTCDNCDICFEQCPVEAIKKVNGRLFWSYKCESCMRCVQLCPQRAIQTTHGFSGIMLYLAFAVIPPLLSSLTMKLNILNFDKTSNLWEFLWSTFLWFIFLIILFICYRLLHFLMKYKYFNKLIAYSSLSKYKFWRRYKSPKSF
ncbi:EFR1 family ferrodoxin [Bacteroidota bacterium]